MLIGKVQAVSAAFRKKVPMTLAANAAEIEQTAIKHWIPNPARRNNPLMERSPLLKSTHTVKPVTPRTITAKHSNHFPNSSSGTNVITEQMMAYGKSCHRAGLANVQVVCKATSGGGISSGEAPNSSINWATQKARLSAIKHHENGRFFT